jgi:AraC-like DNA-binding protein
LLAEYLSCVGRTNRQRTWQGFITQLFGPADIDISDESNFFGEIYSDWLGRLNITHVRSSFEVGKRKKAHVLGAKEERLLFVILKSGVLRVAQGNRECELAPGACTIFDSSAPYVFQHSQPTEVINVSFPADLLSMRVRDPRRFIANTLDGHNALHRILCDFVGSLVRESRSIAPPLADQLSRQVTDLIGCVMENSDQCLPIESSPAQSAVYRRCVALIERNLGNPELGPTFIAGEVGISVRYLHSIFRASGQSVGDLTRRLRLRRAYQELKCLPESSISIKEIAYRNGFRNPAHFASAFKTEFSCSPSDIRASDAPSLDQLASSVDGLHRWSA